jgi:hypothetical protein
MWLRNICCGLLIGLCVSLKPGGNDTPVLRSIFTFSPRALPALLVLPFEFMRSDHQSCARCSGTLA